MGASIMSKKNSGLLRGSKVITVEDIFVKQVLQLVDDVSVLLGRRHWAYQLGMLFMIDLDLSIFTYTSSNAKSPEYFAFTVEGLVAMWDWLDSLDLSQEPGC